ncbi:MAG: class I SAM-dependent methyltransferase [Epsilonproteobacteria bacterium]|nr:class I SAM-dependent methyltransferase [Campylobacterota bacterium]
MPRINNTKFYTTALKKYGSTAQGLNWHDAYSQTKRFEVIYDLIKADLTHRSVIDAGCGFGDFYLYLQKRHCQVTYKGYDIVDEVVEIAQQRTSQDIKHRDILTDPLEVADIYIASGSMNILNRFETYLFIERCFAHSNIGFVFNLPYGKNESAHFNYFLPQEINHFAQKFPCEISLVTGYLPHDFTLFLKRI